MKNKVFIGLSMFILFALAAIANVEAIQKSIELRRNNEKLFMSEEKSNSMEYEIEMYQLREKNLMDSINELNSMNRDKFTFVKNRFAAFNRELSDTTVEKFLEVSTHFDLDVDDKTFDLLIHQILLESGAKQCYNNTHAYAGEIMKSSAGATGFGQIMPKTALSFLLKFVDPTEMEELGCEDFSYVHSTKDAIRWMEDENNNIALWGVIMRYNLDHSNNNIVHALISYHDGGGGMRQFLKTGASPGSHEYIQKILSKRREANKILKA